MSRISLRNVDKAYHKKNLVVKDFSLEIFDQEFLVLVGPSGCGKTTTLRMIAGLEEITKGDLYINDERQNDKDPAKRKLSFVFQNYALLPNLTVYKNIEFGLLNYKLPKLQKKFMVEKVAKKLQLFEKMGSYPHQLSGGQRQRVALARVLVDINDIILFDEPLSNLDAVLRAGMRTELVKVQDEYDTTSVYVTHDQIEAMSMADRICLIIDGKIIQVGTPYQMYEEPISLAVADFIGTPDINTISVKFDGDKMLIGDERFTITNELKRALKDFQDQEVTFAIRPQNVIVSPVFKSDYLLAEVSVVENFGNSKLLHLSLFNKQIRAVVDRDFECGKHVYVSLKNKAFVFDGNGRRIFDEKITNIALEGFEEQTLDEAQVIRELINYGYNILTNDVSSDKKITINKISEHNYICKDLNVEVNEFKRILDYLPYIK